MAHDSVTTPSPSPPAETDKVDAKEVEEDHTSKTDSVSKTSISDELDEGEVEDSAPPLPDEVPPPLPNEPPPGQAEQDDGWAPVWDENAQAYYFYNRFTGLSQWENPRVPEASAAVAPPAPGTTTPLEKPKPARIAGGYDPAIHGDYDPNADYAKVNDPSLDEATTANGAPIPGQPPIDAAQMYTAQGTFNRFTGRWQAADLNPDNYTDDAKSKRQMNAYFDVDAAANSHDGRSLKAERASKKLSRKEVKAFKDKRREKKEEKRRAWLRD